MYRAPSNWLHGNYPDDRPAQPRNQPLARRMEAAGYAWDGAVWTRTISLRTRTSRAGVRYTERVTRYVREDGAARVRRVRL